MERIYIDNDMARFTRRDLTLVDMDLFDGRHFEKLEPRRFVPNNWNKEIYNAS